MRLLDVWPLGLAWRAGEVFLGPLFVLGHMQRGNPRVGVRWSNHVLVAGYLTNYDYATTQGKEIPPACVAHIRPLEALDYTRMRKNDDERWFA